MKLDQEARYHIWQALFKSRVWYSIVLTTRISDRMKQWSQGYLYRSIKMLRGITGRPSTEVTYQQTFQFNPDETLNYIWTQALVNRLLSTPVAERIQILRRYNLDTDTVPTDTNELLEAARGPKEMWRQAKLVLTKASSGLFKWWINQRYQGHTRSHGVIKCTCDHQTTLNQTHIIHCPRFRPSYALTAAEKDVSIEQIKHRLAAREDDLD